MSSQHMPAQWPVFDCMGRVVRAAESGGFDFICQGRAFRDGKWLPWHTLSALTYENRKMWPRDGYEVRRIKEQP